MLNIETGINYVRTVQGIKYRDSFKSHAQTVVDTFTFLNVSHFIGHIGKKYIVESVFKNSVQYVTGVPVLCSYKDGIGLNYSIKKDDNKDAYSAKKAIVTECNKREIPIYKLTHEDFESFNTPPVNNERIYSRRYQNELMKRFRHYNANSDELKLNIASVNQNTI